MKRKLYENQENVESDAQPLLIVTFLFLHECTE